VTLGLGIGASTCMFTVVRSVLLRPLAFPNPQALQVITYYPTGAPFWLYPSLSDADYVAFREYDRSFEAVATFASAPMTLTGAGDAVRVSAATVTPDFFRVLETPPSLGRAFVPEDAEEGREDVVLISDNLWRGRFGADPTLISKRATLDGVRHTVIGVLPAGFSYPAATDVWVPLKIALSPNRSFSRPVIGRLKDGVSREQAQAALEAFVQSRPARRDRGAWTAQVMPLKEAMVGNMETSLIVFSGAVALVLLIACANVANLLLMRTVSRRHEIATRLALGSSRGRLIRLLLAESAVVALGGGLLGTLIAMLGQPALLALVPAGTFARDTEIHMDGWVLAFALGVATLTAVIVGLTPALQAGREDLAAVSRESTGSSNRRTHRIRHALVVAELALALVLLVGTTLLAKSFLKLRSIEPGFDPGRVMTMTLDVPPAQYPTAVALREFHGRLLSALGAAPGVQSAAAVNWLPLGNLLLRGDISAEGGAALPDNYLVTKASVSPGYFQTMGIRLNGRDFTDRDRAGAPGVAIVSESIARRIWPNADAIGKRIAVASHPAPEDWLTIVGVVADVRQSGLKRPPAAAVYQPYPQVGQAGFLSHMTFLVRTEGRPEIVAPMMRAALRDVDPSQAPQSIASMESVVADTIAEPQFQTRLVGIFSALALLLAAIGIYGVLSASVVERQREIGIRMALGADTAAVMRLVLRRTVALTAFGLVLGTLGAIGVTKVLRTLLFDVTPTDASAFSIAALVLASAGLLAGLWPARKASALDPLIVLKTQ
jgi:putative ABC transport system permease protein